MKIVVVYVYAVIAGQKYDDYAFRFLMHYQAFQPGIEHDSVVVLNGIRANSELTCLFSCLPNCSFLEHDNSGYDIGAFQLAARKVPCDLMVFFGASSYLRGGNWLKRMSQAYELHGNALYGAMGNRGDGGFNVFPHIRTTGFWLDPKLLNAYPMAVTQASERYQFEHGRNCLTQWVGRQGLRSFVVSWHGEYLSNYWDAFANGFHRGDQSELLVGDRLSEPPFYPIP
jgi:hypothetical protein